MKTLKITFSIALFLALFIVLSSQTDQAPSKNEVNNYETPTTQFDLLAHERSGMRIPTQG